MIRQDMRFDTRSLKHRLRRSEVTLTELNTHLDELPDDAEEVAQTEVTFSSPYEDRHYRGASDEPAAD